MFSLVNTNVNKILFNKLPYFLNILNTLKSNISSNVISEILVAPMQKEEDKKPKKVSVIGAAGHVGQTIAYNLIIRKICDEVVLYDIKKQEGLLCGIGLDLIDGTSFANHPKIKFCFDGENTKNSNLLIICTGLASKIGHDRKEFFKENIDIFKTLIPMLSKLSPDCVMLVVSNPVEIMSYAAWKFSGFPFSRVLGSGTTLDTSRLKFFLSKKLGISPKSINALVIGEHGNTSVTCWSTINVAGTRLRDCKECFGLKADPECWSDLHKLTLKQAHTIQYLRGFTSYGISMVVSELSEAILFDKKTVHPVSIYCNGIHGIKVESFLSLPAVIGNQGVHQIVKQKLDCEELQNLRNSACILDKVLSIYKWDADKKAEKKSQCNN